jgi:nitrite reductase/ring-hydroxylating ferredoxin subunit
VVTVMRNATIECPSAPELSQRDLDERTLATLARAGTDPGQLTAAGRPRRTLPPYPHGWYAICFADELRPGALLVRPFMGREVLLLRTESGAAAAMDVYCPHLGAHLGYGGRVEGELLRCPFHGFRFDAAGACVATAYGSKPPQNARLQTFPLRERNGMLLLHHGAGGAAPTWEVPALDSTGWSRPVHRRFILAAHPQETTENSVDLGHFSVVHRYRTMRMLRDPIVAGPYLSTKFSAHRDLPLIGRWLAARQMHFDFEFETHIHGLGYSQVDVRVRGFDIRARLWVLPTPIDAERIAIYLAASGSGAADTHPALRVVPSAVRAALIGRGLLAALIADARQDFAVWEHKAYVERPLLARGDGPIAKYRAWAAQFYA